MKVLLLSQIATIDYKYTFSLANSLKKCGNEVELVIDDKKDNEYCECVIHNKFLTSRKDISKLKKLINYIESYKYILNKVINENFDIVHVQWFQFSPIDYYFLKKIKKYNMKIVVSIHDILPFNEKKFDYYFHKKIYHTCDNIIVQALTNIKRFDELFPSEKNKIKFIPHGHFLDFADIHNMKKSREKLNIPNDKFVYLFFGQIKKVKGVGILLEAFGELVQNNKDVYLVIAGSVWKDDFQPYQEIIDKFNLNSDNIKLDIRFIPDDQIGIYYSACDIAVLPYLDVYQSGVIQLTYAHNKPAIATAIPPFLEIVEDNVSGFVCQPNSVESLKDQMVKSIEKKNSLDKYAKNGIRAIKEKYCWEKIANEINDLYRESKV